MTDLGFGITLALKDLFTKNARKIEQSYKSLDGTIADSSEKINKNMERVQKGAMLVGAGVAALAIPLSINALVFVLSALFFAITFLGVLKVFFLRDVSFTEANCFSGA